MIDQDNKEGGVASADKHTRLHPIIFGATRAEDFRLIYSPGLNLSDEGRLLTLCRGAIEALTGDNGFRSLTEVTWVAAISGDNALFGMASSGEYLAKRSIVDKHGRNLSYFLGYLFNPTSGVSLPLEPSWYAHLYRYIDIIQDERITATKQIDEDISVVWNDDCMAILSQSSQIAGTAKQMRPVSCRSGLIGSINLLATEQATDFWYSILDSRIRRAFSNTSLCFNVQSEATAERLLRNGTFDFVSYKQADKSRYVTRSDEEQKPLSQRETIAARTNGPVYETDEDGRAALESGILSMLRALPIGALQMISHNFHKVIDILLKLSSERTESHMTKDDLLKQGIALKKRSDDAIRGIESRMPASKRNVQD
jgi:hypothetical protein